MNVKVVDEVIALVMIDRSLVFGTTDPAVYAMLTRPLLNCELLYFAAKQGASDRIMEDLIAGSFRRAEEALVQ